MAALIGEVEIREGITYYGSLEVIGASGGKGRTAEACYGRIPGTGLGTATFKSYQDLKDAVRSKVLPVK